MKKFLQLPFLLVAALLSSIPISAHDFEVDGIYYDIRSYAPNDACVTFRGELHENYNTYVGNVVIPPTVTYNGITYPVTEIGYYAFDNCPSLTSITIPNSIIVIDRDAFTACFGLTEVNISDLSAWCRILFGDHNSNPINYANKLKLNGIEINDLVIPNDVTEIKEYAFHNFEGLTSVTIPNSVTSIGSYAFRNCENLKRVINLSGLTLNLGSTDDGYVAYYADWLLNASNAYVDGDFAWTNVNNENTLIAYLGNDSELDLPSDFRGENYAIGDYIFANRSNLNKVTIPKSVSSIANNAFNGCDGLTEINYDAEDCNMNDSSIFKKCPNLKIVNIGNTVKTIPQRAFEGCIGLTSITIPNSVTSIGNYAFDGCTGLISVTIPDSVTEIGRDAFSDCVSLQRISIPTLVTSIKDGTFYNCSSLSEVIIPNSVTSIGLSAFRDCSSLTNIVLPNNISSIDRTAFFGCMGLISTTFATTPSSATFKPTTQTNYIPYFYYQDYYDGSESLKNLDPNTNYSYSYGLKINDTYCKIQSSSFTTLELTWANGRFDATSTSSARLIVETNCDATAGTGYEWRRIDAPDIIASSKVSCPVVDGMLVGTLRNLNPDVYYKFRPYYTSASGNTYYGDWVGFYTADANVYFEPEVRTYRDYSISQNSVKVKGYALEGTDVIISQGFEYWETGNSITPLSTEDRKIVTSTGIAMSATISDLEYDTTYKYRAFVTTAKGTVYGEEVEFTTGCGPTGIENIEIKSNELSVVLRENPVTNTAWIKAIGNACNVIQYTITSMSGSIVGAGNVALDGEWNAIELNCHSGIYLMTVSDGLQAKTLRLIVR